VTLAGCIIIWFDGKWLVHRVLWNEVKNDLLWKKRRKAKEDRT